VAVPFIAPSLERHTKMQFLHPRLDIPIFECAVPKGVSQLQKRATGEKVSAQSNPGTCENTLTTEKRHVCAHHF